MTHTPMIGAPSSASDWKLAPQGAAVHLVERVAVIADVHLGYEWSRGAGGDLIPAHSLTETLAKLERLCSFAKIERLVVGVFVAYVAGVEGQVLDLTGEAAREHAVPSVDDRLQ